MAQKCLGVATVMCSDTISVGDTLKYAVSIPVDSIFSVSIQPPFAEAGVEIITGPYKSSKSLFVPSNGKLTKTFSCTYTYALLAKCEGVITIPSFVIERKNGKEYYSVPSKTIVCKKNFHVQHISDKEYVSQDSLFLITSVDKACVDINDSILVTTKLYLRGYELSELSLIHRSLPDYCICKDVDISEVNLEKDSIGDWKCYSLTIGAYWLHPLKTGKITIPPSIYDIKHWDKSIDIFDAFFGTRLTDVSCTRSTEALDIQVTGQYGNKQNTADGNDVQNIEGIVYGLDLSGSMSRSIDFKLSRLEVAKEILRKLSQKDSITVFPFARNIDKPINLPRMSTIFDTIANPQKDGTALYDFCLSIALNKERRYKNIILLTDGSDNGSHVSQQTTIDILNHQGIRVDIVCINSMKDSVKVKDADSIYVTKNAKPHKEELRQLARSTGGLFIDIINEKDIKKVAQLIRNVSRRTRKDVIRKELLSGSILGRIELLLN